MNDKAGVLIILFLSVLFTLFLGHFQAERKGEVLGMLKFWSADHSFVKQAGRDRNLSLFLLVVMSVVDLVLVGILIWT